MLKYLLLLLLTGCGLTSYDEPVEEPTDTGLPPTLSIPGPSGSDGTSIGLITGTATADSCEHGGKNYIFYYDKNSNFKLDTGESIIDSTNLCYAVDGKDGDNGLDGKDGEDGKDGDDAVIDMVTLCNSSAPHAEIAIKINGKWMAYFENSNGSNRRLTTLVDGQRYMSTDGIQTCTFTTADLDNLIRH